MFSPPLHRKPISHGLYGYRDRGCRCRACVEANNAAQRRHRASRRRRGLCAFGPHPARTGMATCFACGVKYAAKALARYHRKKQQQQAAA